MSTTEHNARCQHFEQRPINRKPTISIAYDTIKTLLPMSIVILTTQKVDFYLFGVIGLLLLSIIGKNRYCLRSGNPLFHWRRECRTEIF